MRDLGEEISDKKHQVAFAIEDETLSLPVEEKTLH